MSRPEHAQRVDNLLEHLEMTIDTLFDESRAVATVSAIHGLPAERTLAFYSDVGGVRVHRSLLDAGFYDDRPSEAETVIEGLKPSLLGFQTILSGVDTWLEQGNG